MNSAFILTVSQLNKIARSTLDGVPALSRLWLAGEISNFKFHYSGHLYFSLKDETSSVRCVMFSATASRLQFLPQDGMKVICRGRISIYEKDGQYQFYADDMQPDGLGAEHLAFLQLKEKLEAEGLFESSRKRKLPQFPQKIAVLTSPTGAVWHDIVHVVSRRWPLTEVCLFPVPVQGENACDILCQQFVQATRDQQVDVIILGRGGGSSEDLLVFNQEKLVRLVANSPISVISAIGHQTDHTLCDFAADCRAPTPSAAAELAVPSREELQAAVSNLQKRLTDAVRKTVQIRRLVYQQLTTQAFPVDRRLFYQNHRELLTSRIQKINTVYQEICKQKRTRFTNGLYRLELLNPLHRLCGGYAYVSKDRQAVLCADDLQFQDLIQLRFSDGQVTCQVIEKG